MAAQLFYRGTERKVKNTINYESAQLCIFKLWMGSHYFTHHCSQTLPVPFSLGRRRSKWQAVGSLEENKIRTQVIYSFILRPWQSSDSVVLELDISPPSSSLPVVLVFCHLLKASSELKIFAHLQQLNHSTFDWVFKRFIAPKASAEGACIWTEVGYCGARMIGYYDMCVIGYWSWSIGFYCIWVIRASGNLGCNGGTFFGGGRLLWIMIMFQQNLLQFSSLSLVYGSYEQVAIWGAMEGHFLAVDGYIG